MLVNLANSNAFHAVGASAAQTSRTRLRSAIAGSVYSSIIVSSVLLAMETPAVEIEGPLPRSVGVSGSSGLGF
eukprot:3724474-Rhodomonas_salina.1